MSINQLPTLNKPVPEFYGDFELWANAIVTYLSDPANIEQATADINLPVKDTQGRVIISDAGITTYDAAGNVVIAPNNVAIDTDHLVNAAITTSKIASSAVSSSKLADLAVDANKLADSAVTTTKIANAAVGSAAIASAAVGTAHIANAAITTALIGDAQIVSAKIADAAVNTINIANAAITSALIQDAAISSAKIGTAAITSAKISDSIQSNNFTYTPGVSASGWKISGTQAGSGAIVANAITIVDSSGNIILQSGANASGTLVDDINTAGTTADWNTVSSRPTELVDGRVAVGLDASGNVAQTVPDSKVAETAVTQHQGAIDGQQIANGTAIDISGYDKPVFIQYPGGGYLSIPLPSQTGAIQIKLPVSFNGVMLRFSVSMYNYSANTSYTVEVGGYMYTASGVKHWYQQTAVISGNANTDHTVRFGHDTAGNACIWIGETTDVWQYPTILVHNFQGSYRQANLANWGAGWEVSLVTSFDTIRKTVSDASISSWNNAVNVPANLAALGGSEAIKNTDIVINADGTLTGAGGGQVSLSGLGFTGDWDATAGSPVYFQATQPSTSAPDGSFWIHNSTFVMKVLRSGTWQNVGFSNVITASNISTYIAGAAIGNAQIANAAIGSAKIADAAITSVKIVDGAIVAAKIGSAAIQTAHIATAAIDSAKIANTLQSSNWEYTPGVSASGWRLSGTQTGGGLIEGSQIKLYKADGTILLDSNSETGKIVNDIVNAATTADWTGLNGKPADSALLNSLQDWSDLNNVPTARLYKNLVDATSWTIGTSGTQGDFQRSGTDTENFIVLGTGPKGYTQPLWVCQSDTGAGNNADGGWNNYLDAADGYDNTKTYRFTVFAKQSESTGTVYLGCAASLYLNGTTNNNPYFWAGDLPQNNKWYLLVGLLHGSGYTGTALNLGGVYDPETGEKVLAASEFKQKTATVTQNHRAYLYYSNTTTNQVFFAEPTMYEVNGDEPTLQSMMSMNSVLNIDQTWEDLGNVPYGKIYDSGTARRLGWNSDFSDWTAGSGNVPDTWTNWANVGAIIKEASDVFSGLYSLRYDNVSVASGIYKSITWGASPKPLGTYIKGSFIAKVLNVVSGAPGLMLDVFTNSAYNGYRRTKVPIASLTEGIWHRTEFVARVESYEQIYGLRIYVMASYASMIGGQYDGTVLFDSLEFDFYDGTSDNTLITLDADGTLNNAGGGQVTIGGLGYAGDLNATASGMDNMFINGSAELENSKYFTQGAYTTAEALSGKGCHSYTSNTSTYLGTQWVPVDPNAVYEASVAIKCLSGASKAYLGLCCIDETGTLINYHECYVFDQSVLYQDVNIGDTVIKVVPDASIVWGNANFEYLHLNSLADHSDLPTREDYRITNVDTSDPNFTALTINTTTSTSATAGSLVGRAYGGGTYTYGTAFNQDITGDWQVFNGIYEGVNSPTSGPGNNQFRIGTKYVKFMGLLNRLGQDTTYLDEIVLRRMPKVETRNSVLGALAALNTIDGSVYINQGSIVADLMAADSILALAIAAGAVTTDKIAAGAITAGKIAANTITAGQIASGTITATQIATNTITAALLVSGAITTDKLAANAVTAAKIAAGTITATQIASSTITASQIAANTITATQLAASTITAAQIASNTITAAQIAANAITTSELAANAVTAAQIAANAITSDKLAANSVQAQHLQIGTDGTETGNNSNVSMVLDAYSTTPISIVDNATGLTVFAVQLVDGSPTAIVSGTANTGFISNSSAITDDVKKSINKYFLGGSGLASATPGTMTSGATKSFTHAGSADGIVNLVFKLNKTLFSNNAINQNYTAPEWRIDVYRGSSTGTLLYSKTFTGTASNTYEPDVGLWLNQANITIDEGYVDTGAPTSGSQLYTIKATRISGTPTDIYLSEFSGDAPSFEVNTLDKNSSGGYSWVDKDTGFTIKSGTLFISAYSTASVTFTDAFTTIYSVNTGNTSTGNGTWITDAIQSYSNTAITIRNYMSIASIVHWQAVGYTA